MASQSTRLNASPRTVEGSRANRRLRRSGRVPGVLYGGGADPVPFDVDARELRHALAARGAVLELALDGETQPAVLKDSQRNPVRGDTTHIDLLRVRLDVAIQATVVLHLEGAEDAPGVKEGGVLEQPLRELNVEALPTDIPEQIAFDVSHLEMASTVTLSEVTAPPKVTLLDDPETVVATITAPRLEVETEEEIETETELVGQEGEAAEGEESVPAEDAAEEAAAPDTTSE
jgi:large subunit ribosomal protein L25